MNLTIDLMSDDDIFVSEVLHEEKEIKKEAGEHKVEQLKKMVINIDGEIVSI